MRQENICFGILFNKMKCLLTYLKYASQNINQDKPLSRIINQSLSYVQLFSKLAPRVRLFLEQLTAIQLVTGYPVSFGVHTLITAFTKVHWILSKDSSIQLVSSTYTTPELILVLSFYHSQDIPSSVILLVIIMYAFLVYRVATCPSHFIILLQQSFLG